MPRQLRFTIVDPDTDYLGIEVFASSGGYSGVTKIYGALDELSKLCDKIEGFPSSVSDKRTYILGSEDQGVAGGFCALSFYCSDGAGHAAVAVRIEGQIDHIHTSASSEFSFSVTAAELDDLMRSLRRLQLVGQGIAELK